MLGETLIDKHGKCERTYSMGSVYFYDPILIIEAWIRMLRNYLIP